MSDTDKAEVFKALVAWLQARDGTRRDLLDAEARLAQAAKKVRSEVRAGT